MTGGSSTLSTLDFIRRLADTELGKRLAQRADSEVDALIDDITERYEEHGRRASQIFRRYSQVGTVVVSVIVALCLNINAVTIFRTFQNNEELTRAIAGQAEQAMVSYQVQAELLKASAKKDASEIAAIGTDIENLKGSVRKFKKAVDEAEKLGLPIGWSDDIFFNSKDIEQKGRIFWIFTTILTGFLIGLGGPFWFDVVKRFSVVPQLAGALVRQPPAKDETGDGTKPQANGTTVFPEDPKTAFKTVVRAQRIIDNTGAKVGGFLGPRAMRL